MSDRTSAPTELGRLLKSWREHARFSQLELATTAEVSQRHLSFIETGRSRPGADVLSRLAEALDVPLRDRNRLLEAAGLPPRYPEGRLADADVAPFRAAITSLLAAHEPYPAFVLDRWWDVVDANAAALRLFPKAADGSGNIVEAFLAPGGMREMIVNFPEVAATYLRRLRAEVAEASDPRLHAILARATALLADVSLPDVRDSADLIVCPKLRIGDEVLSIVSMVARFGATRAVTLDELRVELIYPADPAADRFFRDGASDGPRAAAVSG